MANEIYAIKTNTFQKLRNLIGNYPMFMGQKARTCKILIPKSKEKKTT